MSFKSWREKAAERIESISQKDADRLNSLNNTFGSDDRDVFAAAHYHYFKEQEKAEKKGEEVMIAYYDLCMAIMIKNGRTLFPSEEKKALEYVKKIHEITNGEGCDYE